MSDTDAALETADKVLAELAGRRGFWMILRDHLPYEDPEIYDEIRHALADIIRNG
jgi:hypothetical protein